MLNVDLHCHSTVSDGLLSPEDLVKRAAARGIRLLALTDHDDIGGLLRARVAAESPGNCLVNGVERPGESCDVGQLPGLLQGSQPVWELWSDLKVRMYPSGQA